MKGYLFPLSDKVNVNDVMADGNFGVEFPARAYSATSGSQKWRIFFATLADLTTIQPGEKVFFFQKRRVYGVGQITGPPIWNGANAADPFQAEKRRVVFDFSPAPQVFSRGIDMDELLSSPKAGDDWAMRFFYKKSVLQLDAPEMQAIEESLARRFPDEFGAADPPGRPGQTAARRFSLYDTLQAHPTFLVKDSRLRYESMLHGLLIEELMENHSLLVQPPWLHTRAECVLFHEVAASPPKPAKYSDFIDIMQIVRRPGFQYPLLWNVIECKRDKKNRNELQGDLAQLMKYVDYIARMKCHGDYNAVTAHYIYAGPKRGHGGAAKKLLESIGQRTFVLDTHDEEPSRKWNNVSLWQYKLGKGHKLELVKEQ